MTPHIPAVCFFTGWHELGLQKYEVSKKINEELEAWRCTLSNLNAQLTFFFMYNFEYVFHCVYQTHRERVFRLS